MEDQVEILDSYITTCMIIVESTIHSHNLEDYSPKNVEAARTDFFLEVGPPSQSEQHTNTNTTNGKDHVKISKHGQVRLPRQTFNSGKTTGKQRNLQGRNSQRKGTTTRIPTRKNRDSSRNQTLEMAIKQLAHIKASIQTYLEIKRVMNPSTYKVLPPFECRLTKDFTEL
jgi:hypothetical protein